MSIDNNTAPVLHELYTGNTETTSTELLENDMLEKLSYVYGTLAYVLRIFERVNPLKEEPIAMQAVDFIRQLTVVDRIGLYIEKDDNPHYVSNPRGDIDTASMHTLNSDCPFINYLGRTHMHPFIITEESDTSDRYLRCFLHATQMLVAPIASSGKYFGTIVLTRTRMQSGFTSVDMELLAIVSNYLGLLYEQKALFKERMHAEIIKHDMENAGQIQAGLYPKDALEVNSISVFGTAKMHYNVGGDYFDYFLTPEQNGMFIVADVMGKGLSAALMAALLRSSFHGLYYSGIEIDNFIALLQDYNFNALYESEMLITLIAGRVYRNNVVEFVNCGHLPPLWYHGASGKAEYIESENMILGVQYNDDFVVSRITLEPGDALFLYTDGCIETKDASGDIYDSQRLLEIVERSCHLTAQEICSAVLADVYAFSEGKGYDDDITLCVLTA